MGHQVSISSSDEGIITWLFIIEYGILRIPNHPRRQHQRRRFDAQNPRPQAHRLPTRLPGHRHFLIREPGLRTDCQTVACEGANAPRSPRERAFVSRMTKNAQPPRRPRASAIIRPGRRLLDVHQHITATLLAGLDDVAAQFFQAGFARMDDAMLTRERNKGSNTQFSQFFDQELASIAPGQRRRHLESKIQLELRRSTLKDIQIDLTASNMDQAGGVSMAVAVEQGDQVAGAEPANHGEMMRFIIDQRHRPGSERPIDVKSCGHPWYNTPLAAWRLDTDAKLPDAKPKAVKPGG